MCKVVSKSIVVSVMFLLMAGIGYAANTISKKAGDYTVTVRIDRDSPIVGKNNMDISVKDAAGKAVTDANVKVEYFMAPMPGMPASNYKAEAELNGEVYKAVISPSMAGPWNVAIKVNRGGKTATAKLTIDVQ
jgi:hypothetical protein